MKALALLLVSAGVALAQYGDQDAPSYPAQDAPVAPGGYGSPAPVAYPPVWPSWGHHNRHRGSRSWSRSRSRSRSHSRSDSKSDEHHKKKCNSCRRLGLLSLDEDGLATSITYFKDNDGCKKAVITCPFNDGVFNAILVSNTVEPEGTTAVGVSTQTVATCNKRGNWESPAFAASFNGSFIPKPQEFKSTGCYNLNTTVVPEELSNP